VKKSGSVKLSRGLAPSLLLLGIVAVLLLLLLFIFGPWELPGFGQLSQRQIDQAISAQVATPPAIPPDDSDKDGFSDGIEDYIRTDEDDNCADDANDAAWPPDFNNDKQVNTADVDMFRPYLGQKVKGVKNRRFDLDANKVINVSDILTLSPYMNKGCPFQFMSNPRFEGSNVIFRWAPVTEVTVLISAVDLTKSGQLDCNLSQSYQSSAFASTIGIDQQTYGWYGPEGGHEYCVALLSRDTNSFLVSNAVRFTVPDTRPDLVITSLRTNKTAYSIGETVVVSITIQNQSSSAVTSPFMTIYSMSPFSSCSPEGVQGKFVSASLAAGASQTFTGSFIIPSAGIVPTIQAMVDAYCQIAESNESNNRRSIEYVISTPISSPSPPPTTVSPSPTL